MKRAAPRISVRFARPPSHELSLGRNAAVIDAGAAEVFALDQRDLPAALREARLEERAGLAGADDDCIEALRHGLLRPQADQIG